MINKYAKLLESEFGLKGELSLEQIHDGPDNNVYIVTDRDNVKYVLRESKRLGKNVIFETEVLMKLNQHGFSVPKIVKTLSGNYFITIENTQLVLFIYVQGTQIEKLNLEYLKTDFINRGGGKLGELHSLTNSMNISSKPSRTIFTEFDRLLNSSSALVGKFKGLETVIDEVSYFHKEALEKVNSGQELMGIIHNDYRIQNLIYTDKDCFIIDFDWACEGPLLKDLGLAIAEWSMFSGISGPSKEAIDKFIISYNEKSPKKVTYDKNLIFWICFACLSDTCTFLVDVSEGVYPGKEITNVDQCHMYKKFKYFFTL